MTIFEPYAHQVGGHSCMFKLDKMICKPLIPRECEFYQTIYREFPPLVPLTPEFHGSITIHNQKTNTTNNTELKVSPTDNNKLTIYRNPSLTNNFFKLNTITDLPSTSSSSYIVLEDLTFGMSKPCAMDMKVGTRQRFTTSTLLGFRVCGMRVHRRSGLYTVDRLFGRGLTPDTVEDAVAAFLFDGLNYRVELIPSILAGLQRMISVVSDPSNPFRFYTSSLLFIYEGDPLAAKGRPPQVALKIIDFAHAIPKCEKEGEGDDGVLLGLRNLVIVFQNIAARHGNSSNNNTNNNSNSSSSDNLSVLSEEEEEEEEEEEDKRWELARVMEREIIANRCVPITPLLVTSPMKADNY